MNDDIRSPEALADPHAYFRRLRDHDPVHYSERSRAWIISSHAEVCAAFRDPRLSSDRLSPLQAKMPEEHRAAMKLAFDLLRGWMVFNDPPVHGQLRGPVQTAFKPSTVEGLTARIQSVVDELVETMAASAEVDLMPALAFPLPAIVIAELLGVPAEDREKFKLWSLKLSGLVFGAVEQRNRDSAASEAAAEFTDYFTSLIESYEREPGDNLISELIKARDSGEALTQDQMVGACTMLLFGGHETTTSLITSGLVTLLAHPEQLERLRSDPALAPSAVEELMRFAGPAKVMVRHVREAHERGGHRLEVGDRVYIGVAGANRDPAVFDEPDRLDLARDPNPQVGFGHGMHFCIGASLARLETQLALNALLARFPAMRLATAKAHWSSTIIGHAATSVPLELR